MENPSKLAEILKTFRRNFGSTFVVLGVASFIYYDITLTQREKAEKAQNSNQNQLVK